MPKDLFKVVCGRRSLAKVCANEEVLPPHALSFNIAHFASRWSSDTDLPSRSMEARLVDEVPTSGLAS